MIENCILYTLEVIKYYLIMKHVLGFSERKENAIKIVAKLIVLLFSWYITISESNPVLMFILFIIVEVVLLFKSKLWKKILVSIWLIFFIALLDEMFQMLIQLVIGETYTEDWLINITTLTFLGSIVILIKRKTEGEKVSFPYIYYVFLSILSLSEGIIIIVLQKIYEEYSGEEKLYVLIIMALIIMIINIVIVIFLAVSNNGYKQRDILNQEYLKLQEKHYQYLKEINEDVRRFKHDYSSHILNIRRYSDEENYQALNEYVNRITEDTHLLENRITVNNGIIDAILNQAAYEAMECGVKFRVFGIFTEESIIEPYDLCTIFSNLVKNALEAAEKSEEKYVNVYVERKEDYISIRIENSFGGKLIKESGKYSTTKEDNVNHGLGMENAKRAVRKYNGSFFTVDEDKKFKVSIEVKNVKNDF